MRESGGTVTALMSTPRDRVVKYHPAKFSASIMEQVADLLEVWLPDGGWILDPFAGVGRVHDLAREGDGARYTVGVDIEPVFAEAHERNRQGDATCLEFEAGEFDAVVTSPVYPNRMRDSHNATDPCRTCDGDGVLGPDECKECGGLGLTMRNTYTHRLRVITGDRSAKLAPNNAGAMGDRDYWRLHEQAVAEMVRVVQPGGLLVVNVSNHLRTVRKGQPQVEVDTVGRWLNLLSLRRCLIRQVQPVKTPRNGYGANGSARADHEVIIVAHTPPAQPASLI